MRAPQIAAPLQNDCPECYGHGYDVFSVDREPGEEIERNDGCSCLSLRFGWAEPKTPIADDCEAALAFVFDLEKREGWAIRCARKLLGDDRNDYVCPECGEPVEFEQGNVYATCANGHKSCSRDHW